MLIREATSADFAAIAEITNPYIRETVIHFGYEPVTAEELRGMWEKSKGTYPYFVAEAEGAGIVGYVKAGVWRERAAYAKTAEVGIYVRQGHHGKGLGKALYARLIEACRERGFHTLVGGVTLPNEASVRLHEALGFEWVGRFREVGWKFGGWHDVGWWQLRLEP